ncbi:hypothetical protein [Pectobacterium araliae]|uniref:hypothetical protein n=1 Tax=Pectobacterium araliae TaxID=3073862 RepID=UPI0021C40956
MFICAKGQITRINSCLVVILVVFTERQFRFSLHISQLLAKAIPVRGAKLKNVDAHGCLHFCI